MWGEVIEHQHGWRSEYAAVRLPWFAPDSPEFTVIVQLPLAFRGKRRAEPAAPQELSVAGKKEGHPVGTGGGPECPVTLPVQGDNLGEGSTGGPYELATRGSVSPIRPTNGP
jgi:hypothetical protein